MAGGLQARPRPLYGPSGVQRYPRARNDAEKCDRRLDMAMQPNDVFKIEKHQEVKMRNFIRVACVLLTAGTANASDVCINIENDLDRLACYDKVSGRSEAEIEQVDADGAWDVDISKSEFKDTTDVYLRAESDNTLGCARYGASNSARLVIRCSENTTAMLIVTGCHLASGFGGYGQVEYRFDDKPAGKRNFDVSTDNRALGLWSGKRSIGVIKKMIGSEKALFRFTPYGESPVTARFTVSGLEEAIKPLRKECNW